MHSRVELTELLSGYVTENKREMVESVLAERTRHVTVCLEDIYQPHNASACLRSCECLGIQDVHIVEHRYPYEPVHEVAKGSSKWLTLSRYRSPASCIEALRQRNFVLVATSPVADGHDPESLPLDRPVALLFGTEESGLSPAFLAAADTTLRLPMYGFTQSYNISVTVAMAVSRLGERLRASGSSWRLSEEEKAELRLAFYRRIVKRHDLIEEEFRGNA